ncbi:MAG TPA: class I SAM-dependent methyltransferase [Flavobacteriales bacterium]|nr:class I SAM-dependent methyltransferase [Flavobacteriales bacterium]
MDPALRAVRIFGEHAEAYALKYADVGRYKASLDRFLALMPKGAHVLELACGPGNVTRYLIDQRPDLRIWATDLAPEMVEVARRSVPEVEHKLMDMREVGRMEPAFHGVVCAFGLPYLDQQTAARFMRDAASILLPGGALYLSTMEDDPSKSGWEGPSEEQCIMMNYHRARDLDAILCAAGLVPEVTERTSYTSSHGAAVTDLMLVYRR